MINGGVGTITYAAKEINNLPKNDTVTGIKTVNYDYGKIIDAMKVAKIEKPQKKEKVIDSAELVLEIKNELYR